MSKLNDYLNAVDNKLNKEQPNTMDKLLECVFSVPNGETYGHNFSIVKCMGYLQGIRVYVTGRSKSHPLPAKDKVYSVFQGVEKYESNGWKIENS